MENPYETPDAQLINGEDGNEIKLYSIRAIGIATFLGSILAGGYILASNFKALGKHNEANQTLIGACLCGIAIFILAMTLPEDVPSAVFTIPVLLAVVAYAKKKQEAAIRAHQASGGVLYSNWRAAGIALLFLVAIMTVLLGLISVIYA